MADKTPEQSLAEAKKLFAILSQADPRNNYDYDPRNPDSQSLDYFLKVEGDTAYLRQNIHDELAKAGKDASALNTPGEKKSAEEINRDIEALVKAGDTGYAKFIYNALKTGTHIGDYGPYNVADAISAISRYMERGKNGDSSKKFGEADLKSLNSNDWKALEPKGEDEARRVLQSAFIQQARDDLNYLQTKNGKSSAHEQVEAIRSTINKANAIFPNHKINLAVLDQEGKKTADQMEQELNAAAAGWNIRKAREAYNYIVSGMYGSNPEPFNKYMPTEMINNYRGQVDGYLTAAAKALGNTKADYAALDPEGKKTDKEMRDLLEQNCKSTQLNGVRELFSILQTEGGVDNYRFNGKAINLVGQMRAELGAAHLPITALNKPGESRTATEIEVVITDTLQLNALRNADRLVTQAKTGQWVAGWPQEASIDSSPEGLRKGIYKTLTEAGFKVKEGATVDEMTGIIKEQTKLRALAKEHGSAIPGVEYSPTNSLTNGLVAPDPVRSATNSASIVPGRH